VPVSEAFGIVESGSLLFDKRQFTMPKQGLRGIWELIRDLWRELTPVVRTCLFVGLGIGFLLGINYLLGLQADYARLNRDNRVEYRTILLPRLAILVGITILGGVLGTAVGVAVEFTFRESDASEKKKPWYRKGRSSRRKK
jgi:hypothetical protein